MSGFSITEILTILPHRYPFLLVDRIETIDQRRVVGIKNVTINEPFFAGHWPDQPVMPGVLVVEAMAQVGACLVLNLPNPRGRMAYLAGIDRCRFRRPVVPGDTLRIEVELRVVRGPLGKAWAVARVGEEVAAEAEISFGIADEPLSKAVRRASSLTDE
jgi:3-hydroxyacyl-[acyl-carrier-protein] dehydratase